MSRHNLWNTNNNFQRQLFLKNEIKRILLKSIKSNRNISFTRRYLAAFYLSNLSKKSSISYSVFRCIRSGRTWGINRKSGLSRFVLRQAAYNSNLPGMCRASW